MTSLFLSVPLKASRQSKGLWSRPVCGQGCCASDSFFLLVDGDLSSGDLRFNFPVTNRKASVSHTLFLQIICDNIMTSCDCNPPLTDFGD